MSYVILKTDGTILTTITDGTINTTSTSVGLPGRLYPGYGQVMDTNFVHVIENFADAVPPANPLKGQIWFDTSNASPSSSGVIRICPADGEANAANWYTVLTTSGAASNINAANVAATGNITANNIAASNVVSANLTSTNYLTVNVQANIANANVTGNANLANVITNNITTGSNTTSGSLTGNWSLNGALTSNGNVTASGFKSNNWYYADGTPISFAGTYGDSNVASYLPTYSSVFGLFGGGATFNGNTLSTGANTTAGTITGNWTLSPGSIINGLSNIDGANIVGAVASATSATTATTVTNPIQSNITQVGTLSSITTSGVATAQRLSATVATGTAPLTIQSTTKVANLNADLLDGYDTDTAASSSSIVVRDTSGNITGNYIIGNGAFLTGLSTGLAQITNGTSNVSIVSAGGNVTIGIGGTANTAVFSSQGLSLTANVSANNVSANRLTGSLITTAQPNITSVGTLTSLNVSGNINGANVTVTGAFYGNGAGLTNIPSSAIIGLAPSANYSTYAGVVTVNAQPNITSVGTLTSLNVSGKVTAGQLQGDGGNISNLPAANLSGTVPAAVSAVIAGTVTTAAQPNITSVSSSFGSLTFATNSTLNIPGSVSQIIGANTVVANFFQGNGSRLSSLAGANVTGTVSNATYATTAGSVSTVTYSQVISALGFTPLQLSDFTQSISSSGWTRLPNGLIIQWGSVFAPSNSNSSGSFPISFPNACFAAVMNGVGEINTFGGQGSNPTIYTFTNSTFTWHNGNDISSAAWFIAIGY